MLAKFPATVTVVSDEAELSEVGIEISQGGLTWNFCWDHLGPHKQALAASLPRETVYTTPGDRHTTTQ